jgi:hypothetical protein
MDAESRIDAAARRLSRCIPGRRREQTVTAFGTVRSVSGASMSVEVAGAALSVPFSTSCSGAREGDRAMLVKVGNSTTAVAVIKR